MRIHPHLKVKLNLFCYITQKKDNKMGKLPFRLLPSINEVFFEHHCILKSLLLSPYLS